MGKFWADDLMQYVFSKAFFTVAEQSENSLRNRFHKKVAVAIVEVLF